MKFFIQMSIGGFKIFDVSEFQHKGADFSYALIEEIKSTHDGIKNYHTHIVRNDSHGLRLESMRLFSLGTINLLLQDEWYDGQECRMLYLANCGFTKDEINRICDVSFCLIGQNVAEWQLINKLASILITTNCDDAKSQISELLHTKVLDNHLVLAFETSKWKSLQDKIVQHELNNNQTTEYLTQQNGQFVVLNGDLDVHRVERDFRTLFNKKSYGIYKSQHLPINSQNLEVMSNLHIDLHHSSKDYKEETHDFVTYIINKLKDMKL